jgi:hypothetical protein
MKLLALVLAGLIALPLVAQENKDDKKDSLTTMELRANEAFNRGQYSLAKELFTKVIERVKDDPKRVERLQEQVRVCETNIKQLAAALPIPQDNLNEPKVETDPNKRKKHVAPKEGAYEVPIKELGNFEYDADKGGNIPEDIKKLTGAKVRLNGFMIPLDQADNISHFALVPSLFACCFGQPPQIQHQVVVHTPKGKAVSYYPDEIVCEGTLKVEEKKDDGYIVSVFELEVTSVKPAAK